MPSVRSRGSIGLILCALAAAMLGGALVAVSTAAPVRADTLAPAPDPTPSDTPSGTPTPTPPTIDDPGDRLARFPLTVSGRGAEGDRLEVSGASGGSSCTATVAADGTWACALSRLPNGPDIVLRAVSTVTGASAPTRRIAVLSAPTVAAPSGGLVTGGGIHGTAYPGAAVTARASNGATCTFTADSTGAWGCVLGTLPSGSYTVSASQVGPAGFPHESSASSARVPIRVDKTAPAPPAIASPRPGTARSGEPLTFTGTGETGASIGVYASNDSGSSVLCTSPVTGTKWSCTGSMPPGSYLVSALQTDPAGNVSAASNAVSFTFTAPAPIPSSPSSPSKSPTATPTPAVPVVPPGPTSTPTPSPGGPLAGGRQPGMPDWLGTPFTTASAPVVTPAAFPGWLRSILLAAAALLLLALPARLLAGTIARSRAERGERRRGSLFGRNRSTAEIRAAEARLGGRPAASAPTGADASPTTGETLPTPSRWASGAAFAAAAALVTLSSPVEDAGAYVRVILAILIAIIALNAVWVAVGRWAAPHLGAAPTRVAFRPGLLVIVAVAAIASRFFGVQPAVLFGLLLGVLVAEGAGRVARGKLAAIQLAAIATLGVLAWLTVGVLPEPAGVLSAFAVELVNAVSLLALGSAAVALIPVGGLAGRAVFQWSRLVWIGLSLVVYTLLFALLLPVASLVETGENLVVLIVAAVAFAVVSVCVWLWERFVEPARHEG